MKDELSEAQSKLETKDRQLDAIIDNQAKLAQSIENKTREIEHLENENSSKQGDLERLRNENMDITQHMEDLKMEKEDVITQNVLLINQLSEKNDRIHAAMAERENLDREINRLEVTLEGMNFELNKNCNQLLGNRREIANLKKQIVINDTEYRNQLADAESEFSDEGAGKFTFCFLWITKIFKAMSLKLTSGLNVSILWLRKKKRLWSRMQS